MSVFVKREILPEDCDPTNDVATDAYDRDQQSISNVEQKESLPIRQIFFQVGCRPDFNTLTRQCEETIFTRIFGEGLNWLQPPGSESVATHRVSSVLYYNRTLRPARGRDCCKAFEQAMRLYCRRLAARPYREKVLGSKNSHLAKHYRALEETQDHDEEWWVQRDRETYNEWKVRNQRQGTLRISEGYIFEGYWRQTKKASVSRSGEKKKHYAYGTPTGTELKHRLLFVIEHLQKVDANDLEWWSAAQVGRDWFPRAYEDGELSDFEVEDTIIGSPSALTKVPMASHRFRETLFGLLMVMADVAGSDGKFHPINRLYNACPWHSCGNGIYEVTEDKPQHQTYTFQNSELKRIDPRIRRVASQDKSIIKIECLKSHPKFCKDPACRSPIMRMYQFTLSDGSWMFGIFRRDDDELQLCLDVSKLVESNSQCTYIARCMTEIGELTDWKNSTKCYGSAIFNVKHSLKLSSMEQNLVKGLQASAALPNEGITQHPLWNLLFTKMNPQDRNRYIRYHLAKPYTICTNDVDELRFYLDEAMEKNERCALHQNFPYRVRRADGVHQKCISVFLDDYFVEVHAQHQWSQICARLASLQQATATDIKRQAYKNKQDALLTFLFSGSIGVPLPLQSTPEGLRIYATLALRSVPDLVSYCEKLHLGRYECEYHPKNQKMTPQYLEAVAAALHSIFYHPVHGVLAWEVCVYCKVREPLELLKLKGTVAFAIEEIVKIPVGGLPLGGQARQSEEPSTRRLLICLADAPPRKVTIPQEAHESLALVLEAVTGCPNGIVRSYRPGPRERENEYMRICGFEELYDNALSPEDHKMFENPLHTALLLNDATKPQPYGAHEMLARYLFYRKEYNSENYPHMNAEQLTTLPSSHRLDCEAVVAKKMGAWIEAEARPRNMSDPNSFTCVPCECIMEARPIQPLQRAITKAEDLEK